MSKKYSNVKITTQDNFSEYDIQKTFGPVNGNIVRTKNVFRDIWEGIKSLFGVELHGYSNLLSRSRKQATERMQKEAYELGANGIVATRLSTAAIAQNASEILSYGTAVFLTPKPQAILSENKKNTDINYVDNINKESEKYISR